MNTRALRIGIFGTFDVQNFGDLLFPLIAEEELTRRLGPIELLRFSYHAKSPPEWPYAVTSVAYLPALVGGLDGVLIGGGFIIRFDKDVAPGYGPPTLGIHHPTGYWLTPALMALQHGIPLIWNAPGMHCNSIPMWAQPLLKIALEQCAYIRVRDEPSRLALKVVAPAAPIEVLPDTGFGIGGLIGTEPSASMRVLQRSAGLDQPYIVVQATYGLDGFLGTLRTHPKRFEGYRFLVLPIGPVLRDHEANVGDVPGAVHLPDWPHPLLLAELLGRAQAVVGHSYHLAITALACGVPVFCSADLSAGKYSALTHFDSLHPLVKGAAIDPDWILARLGRRIPCSGVGHALDQLVGHWDRAAELLREGRKVSVAPLNHFWQQLPNLLEETSQQVQVMQTKCDAKVQALEAECATSARHAADRLAAATALQGRLDSLEASLDAVRAQAARDVHALQRLTKELKDQLSDAIARVAEERMAAQSQSAAVSASRSMRITAPLRSASRALRGFTKGRWP